MSQTLEYCRECGQPTERAGRSDDSIYCDNCDSGPWCWACFSGERDDFEEDSKCPICRETGGER